MYVNTITLFFSLSLDNLIIVLKDSQKLQKDSDLN